MKKISLILLLLSVLTMDLTFTGCTSDSRELDDQVYALLIGVDKGVENKVRLTVQFPIYKGSGGGGGSSGMQKGDAGQGDSKEELGQVGSTIVQTIEAPSLLEGINLLNTATTRHISFVHSKAIIFSESLAEEEVVYLEAIARFREARRTMQVIVCKGTAENFIKENDTQIGESISKAMELLFEQSDNTGFFPDATFNEFYKGVLSPYEQAFAIYAGLNDFKHLKPETDGAQSPLVTQYNLLPGEEPRKGDVARELIGTAVFDGNKMVGSLNSSETRYFLMVRGEFKHGIITIEDRNEPGKAIPLDIRLGRTPKIKVHFENNIPVIDVALDIEADLVAIQSKITYEKSNRIDDLNNQIETFIGNGVKATIEKTQKELKSDVFAFGGKAARKFFTIHDFEEYNWLAHYPEAKVNVQVNANVRRTGLMLESSPVRSSSEKILSGGE